MGNSRVSNLKPVSAVFSSVTTSTTAGTYTQLPSIVCDEVVFTRVPTTNGVPVNVAYSATPAAGAFLNVATTSIAYVAVPTGALKNANVLFITNESGAAALVVSFMCLFYDNNEALPITARGGAG